MQPGVGTHPALNLLQGLALGKLEEGSVEAVMAHLEECSDCRSVVTGHGSDDFLTRLRDAHGDNAIPLPTPSRADTLPNTDRPTPPPGPANLPPEVAANPHYEILRELGRGGMGVVYLARNRLLARLEALKVLNPDLLKRSGGRERFLREIQSAAMVNHPNVVTAYSAMELGDLLVFAMEYVEGEDLAEVVNTRGPLPIVDACNYVQQAALGLQHAYDKKMVHRDIKPQNLIRTRMADKDVVKILDFGLAKVMSERAAEPGLTGAGQMLGTPDYIAPEQTLEAARSDIRADIYSLGCTLYFLLTGSAPFGGKNIFSILKAHQWEEPSALDVVRPDVPAELAAVVARMMAKDPGQRYQQPGEVPPALMPFMNAEGKAIPASGPLSPEKKDVATQRIRSRKQKARKWRAGLELRFGKWRLGLGISIGVLLLAVVVGLAVYLPSTDNEMLVALSDAQPAENAPSPASRQKNTELVYPAPLQMNKKSVPPAAPPPAAPPPSSIETPPPNKKAHPITPSIAPGKIGPAPAPRGSSSGPSRVEPPFTTTPGEATASLSMANHTKEQALALNKLLQAVSGAIKGNQAEFLQVSLVLLASADSDYDSHKDRGMNEIRQALVMLGTGVPVDLQQRINALKARNAAIIRAMAANLGSVNINQNLSDAQLVRALHVLRRVRVSLVQTSQPKVDQPVRVAIREIDAALRWSASHVNKGAEAELLTQAYILLSAANHDYAGHRPKAKHYVEEALNSLDAQILVGDTVANKINILRQQNIVTLAALKEEVDPALHDPQVVSDMQMLLARALIQQVFHVDSIANGAFIRARLRDADREIALGPTVN